MFDKRSGWSGVGRTASWIFAATLTVMPFPTFGQGASPPALTPGPAQAVTAATPKSVDLGALPQVSAGAPTVPTRLVPRPQNGLSDSEYLAMKARALSQAANAPAPAGEASSPPAQDAAGATAAGAETPGISVGFESNMEAPCLSFTPSDMGLAVGDDVPPYPVLQANNDCIAIFTKAGARAPGYPKSLENFLGFGTGQLFTFDPRALYDAANHRYIVSAAVVDISGNHAWTAVAVSAGDDPGSVYFVYFFPTDTASGWPDFQRIGQDHQAIYLASNVFSTISSCFVTGGCAYKYEQWDLLPKAAMYAGAGFTYYSYGNVAGTATDSTQPANVWNPTDNPRAEFLVGSNNFNGCYTSASTNFLYVWAISNPLFVSGTPGPEVSLVGVGTSAYSFPPSAKQPGTTATIDTGDCRIGGEVSYADGSLYAALTTNTFLGYSGVYLWKIQPFLGHDDNSRCTGAFTNLCPDITVALLRNESLLVYGVGLSSFYPTQQPDSEGNVTTVLNVSGNGFFASFGGTVYISQRVTQPPGTFVDGGIYLCAGQSTYGQFRWGDYTGVAPNFVDGGNQSTGVWFSGMFAGRTSSDHNWSTCIGKGGFTALNQP